PPPVRGVGRAGGFAIVLEDRGDLGSQVLQEQTENLTKLGNTLGTEQPDVETPEGRTQEKVMTEFGLDKAPLVGLFSVFRANVPQLHVDADKRACMVKGVSMKDFADTLSIYQG